VKGKTKAKVGGALAAVGALVAVVAMLTGNDQFGEDFGAINDCVQQCLDELPADEGTDEGEPADDESEPAESTDPPADDESDESDEETTSLELLQEHSPWPD